MPLLLIDFRSKFTKIMFSGLQQEVKRSVNIAM